MRPFRISWDGEAWGVVEVEPFCGFGEGFLFLSWAFCICLGFLWGWCGAFCLWPGPFVGLGEVFL